MTKFLLDSGDPDEYKELPSIWDAPDGASLWGATTNPSLIAKKLSGKKVSQNEAFELQKQIVLQIVKIVPGAVSAEVYADEQTTAEEMIRQGKQIATWHKRVVVKLPTTLEGFKARTELRRQGVPVNNTLVFSQQQIFTICLHERLVVRLYQPPKNLFPSFISPFVGRLDDINEDGMSLVETGMRIKQALFKDAPNGAPWMLEASVRRAEHIRRGILAKTELITAPLKVYQEWFSLSKKEQNKIDPTSYSKDLKKTALWKPPNELLNIDSMNEFYRAIEQGKLNIRHPLTNKGLQRFAADWKTIIA